MAKIANMEVIPKGMSVRNVGGTNFLFPKIRSRKKFKTSLAVRQKMSRAAKKIKVPVLTVAAITPTVVQVIKSFQGRSFADGLSDAGRGVLMNFTGIKISSGGEVVWEPRRMMKGLLPVGGVALINKSGILRGANRGLAKLKVPVRFN